MGRPLPAGLEVAQPQTIKQVEEVRVMPVLELRYREVRHIDRDKSTNMYIHNRILLGSHSTSFDTCRFSHSPLPAFLGKGKPM